MTEARERNRQAKTSPAADDESEQEAKQRTERANEKAEKASRPGADGEGQTVLVVGPDGRPVGTVDINAADGEGDEGGEGDPSRLVEQPAKVMRIGSMIKQLLEEVRAAPLDEAGRARLREIHARSIAELEEGLAVELREELERLSLPFADDRAPSEPELRIAQAQLVGWLEGLFHGIQAALVAQQMAARMQLEQIRRTPQLPMGSGPGSTPDNNAEYGLHATGQYL